MMKKQGNLWLLIALLVLSGTVPLIAQEDLVILVDPTLRSGAQWQEVREFINSFVPARWQSPVKGQVFLAYLAQPCLLQTVKDQPSLVRFLQGDSHLQPASFWQAWSQCLPLLGPLLKAPQTLMLIISAQVPPSAPVSLTQQWRQFQARYTGILQIWQYCLEPTANSHSQPRWAQEITHATHGCVFWQVRLGNPAQHRHVQWYSQQGRLLYTPKDHTQQLQLRIISLPPCPPKPPMKLYLTMHLVDFPALYLTQQCPVTPAGVSLPVHLALPDKQLPTYLDKPLKFACHFKVVPPAASQYQISYYPCQGKVQQELLLSERPLVFIGDVSQQHFSMSRGARRQLQFKLYWNSLANGKMLELQTFDLAPYIDVQLMDAQQHPLANIKLDDQQHGQWCLGLRVERNAPPITYKKLEGRIKLRPMGWGAACQIKVQIELVARIVNAQLPKQQGRSVRLLISSPFLRHPLAPDLALLNGVPVNAPVKFAPGHYRVWISQEGYYPYKGEVEITSGQTPLDLTYPLAPKPRKLFLQISFAGLAPDDPRPGYQAYLISHKIGEQVILHSGDKIIPGQYTLKIKAAGYRDNVSHLLLLPAKAPYTVTKELTPIFTGFGLLEIMLWLGLPLGILALGFTTWFLTVLGHEDQNPDSFVESISQKIYNVTTRIHIPGYKKDLP